MLDVLINIIMALAIGALAVVGYAATRPDTFEIARSTTIAAPAAEIFSLINNLRGFNRWNPFLLKDQATRLTYQTIEEGPGAVYGWEGNRDVGKGRLEIVRAIPHSRVEMKLHMIEPMTAQNRVVFTLEPAGAIGDSGKHAMTKVTWAMDGQQPLMSKVMGLFLNIDAMVGADFEKGLQQMKAIAENSEPLV
jgi:uncharacterized protein YndB with AHSA1/START domain